MNWILKTKDGGFWVCYEMGLPDMCLFASNNLIQFPIIVNEIITYMRLLNCMLLFI